MKERPSDLRPYNSTTATQIGFILTELEMCRTFAKAAIYSGNDEKIARNRENARAAYDAVLRFLPKVALTESEKEEITAKLADLKSDLLSLSETF